MESVVNNRFEMDLGLIGAPPKATQVGRSRMYL